MSALMPEARLGFIEELCVTLRHERKQDEIFVIFTGYFDESNTHGPAPTVILSAYMGNVAQWGQFEKRLIKLQRKYGFTVFHSKDFKARTNEFSRWSFDKQYSLVADLTAAVSRLSHGVSISLYRERYEKEYRSDPIPRKMHMDSQYGICFRACLGRFLAVLNYRENRDRLNIVLEGGHKNVNDCIRIFNDVQYICERQGRDVLVTCTIARKLDCMPLMVADFLASAHFRMWSNEQRGAPEPGELLVPDKKPIPKGWISILELPPNALADLKTNFETERMKDIERRRLERAQAKSERTERS